MKLECYGLGKEFSLDRFEPVKNRKDFWKPKGGLWTSPVGSVWGWLECSRDLGISSGESRFEIVFTGNLIVIDCLEDVTDLPKVISEGVDGFSIDFEKIGVEYDAIHLTCQGQAGLYGWDCETVFVMNPQSIQEA